MEKSYQNQDRQGKGSTFNDLLVSDESRTSKVEESKVEGR